MKLSRFILVVCVLFLPVFFPACSTPSPVNGDGSNTVVQSDLTEFDSISMSIPAQVDVVSGNHPWLEISAEVNILSEINYQVNRRWLVISSKNPLLPQKPIKIKIQTPLILGVEITGDGQVQLDKSSAETLRIKIRGAGKVNAEHILSEKLFVDLYGPGKIEISGEVKTQLIEIADGGKYIAPSLPCDEAFVSLGGSGDLILRVNNHLNATLGGSGNLDYYGNPQLSGKVTGTARITRLGP